MRSKSSLRLRSLRPIGGCCRKQRFNGIVRVVTGKLTLGQAPHAHADQPACSRPCGGLAGRSHRACQQVSVGADAGIDRSLDGADDLGCLLSLVDHQAAGDGAEHTVGVFPGGTGHTGVGEVDRRIS